MDNVMRHTYRELTDSDKDNIKAIKDRGKWLYEFIDNLGATRETSLAKTKVEEAVMWATKHITT